MIKKSQLGMLWSYLWPFFAHLMVIGSFYAVGVHYVRNYVIDLGSLVVPGPGFLIFLGIWLVFAFFAVVFLSLGFLRLGSRKKFLDDFVERFQNTSDQSWILWGSLVALLVPIVLRGILLDGARLTDDESAYRLMAEMLASGRLWVPSHPEKLFFDNQFIINDGKFYAGYLLGWPALLVPGVVLGIPGYMNAIYAALTVPVLFSVLRRLLSGYWARMGIILYLSSPMLMVGAATELTHTTCLLMLMLTTWFALRSSEPDVPWWVPVGVSVCFSISFFIRPLSTLGIGLPLLAYWGWHTFRRSHKRFVNVLGFGLPALVFAALFLLINYLQNGSLWLLSPQRYGQYIIENQYRFTGFAPEFFQQMVYHGDPTKSLAAMGIAVFRLNVGVWGWPCSFVFAFFSWRQRRARLFWWCILSFFLVHIWHHSSGIDSFGPVHYFEVAWPLIALSVFGLKYLHSVARCWEKSASALQPSHTQDKPGVPLRLVILPFAILFSLILTNLETYTQVRSGALHIISSNINMPKDSARAAGIDNAVIFVSKPFIEQKCIFPTRHHAFYRPNNDPDLTDDVLWVNDVGMEENKAFLERHFPNRSGYVMYWNKDCRIKFVVLAETT